jgi:cold shock CspA family protein
MKYDVFISHASEDKADFVQDLAQTLEESGLSVWYDDFTLRIGDSLTESINTGLSQSTHGIVVLSPRFFQKKWPKRELIALFSREDSEDKVVIPIWHQITKDEILSSFPLIADKLAVMSSDGMRNVIRRVFEVVKPRLVSQKHYEDGLMHENDVQGRYIAGARFDSNAMLDEAMLAYMRALRLDPNNLDALRRVTHLQNLGNTLPLYVTETFIKVGIVRFYNERKGFGFIAGENGKDYFVHASGVEEGTTLNCGDRAAFLVEEGFRGPKAVSVRII